MARRAGEVPSEPVLGVDVGGTFTDAVLSTPSRTFVAKRPTTPEDQSTGVIDAVREVLAAAGLEPSEVRSFAHGTTIATNALLEGAVARTAFVATNGFSDLVEIGRQDRPSLYRLEEARPAPLAPPGLRIEVAERAGPEGVIEELSQDELERVAGEVVTLDPEAVAVCLLHADRFPGHEIQLGNALRDRLGSEVSISLSSEAVGTFREYERAATTEVDAALGPVTSSYLRNLATGAAGEGLPEPLVMKSSGGLATLDEAVDHPARIVLSGPAGGAAAAARIASESGTGNLICVDMGGTSCDVSVVEMGRVRETGSRDVDGRPIALPSVDIETVGAGGGSIGWRDPGGALRVGPRSAGANPGPACYGRGGGEPTVTDANLLLGRIPEGTSLSGITPDLDAAGKAIGELASNLGMAVEECAAGMIAIANAEMIRAVRVMTVERGLDPADFALLAFGGAGPLHATEMAAELGLARVLLPADGGVLSAFGLAGADVRRDEARTVLATLSELSPEDLDRLREGADEVIWELRYSGQSFELEVIDGGADPVGLGLAFEEEHERRFGFKSPEAEIQLVTTRRRQVTAGAVVRPSGAPKVIAEGPVALDLGVATAWVGPGWAVRPMAGGILELSKS
ncbi:MAG: hydantoinase/oxoprolinase family protein [Solirubrobacterales bacterium]